MGDFSRISQINDHLFICGYFALSQAGLDENKITCVINASDFDPFSIPLFNGSMTNPREGRSLPWTGVETVNVPVPDIPSADLGAFFDCVAAKIKEIRDKGGVVLVHCLAGVSRSASLCIAYLMKEYEMSLADAFQLVKSKRSIIQPNSGFWAQLESYEARLLSSTTVPLNMGDFCRISQINDHLFICSYFALTQAAIKKNRITCVIDATEDDLRTPFGWVDYVNVPVSDIPSADIGIFFDSVAAKIKKIRDKGGVVLVHCIAGVSSSSTLCIAYLMKVYGLSLADAFQRVKSRRNIIQPNSGFWAQLESYEVRLRRSVTMYKHSV